MMNYLLVIITSLVSFAFFSFSLKLNSANRVVVNTPKSIFESSIKMVTASGKASLNFDETTLNEKLTSYYAENITKYTKDYSVNLYLYRPNDFGNFCLKGLCNSAEVTVKAKIGFSYVYEKTIFYEIRNGAYGNE